MTEKISEINKQLSPLERKILPYLKNSFEEVKERTGLDATSVLRALKFLEGKGVISLNIMKKNFIELGANGIYYKKNHLPERNLLILLEDNDKISLAEARKLSGLSDKEFKVSLGVLKDKALIEIKNGKIFLRATKEELTKKMPEESFIETLPLDESSIFSEQKNAFLELRKRKDIIKIEVKTFIEFELTNLGKKLLEEPERFEELIEELTPEIIKNWKKSKKFREYDISVPVPRIYGGRRHFVNEAIESGKKIWLELGFKEMSGGKVQTSFWNFDALFTAQDHPVRELHDTFFVKVREGNLPEKRILNEVKKAHEKGVAGSKGWQYIWDEKEASKIVLRTHTTCLSAKTLSKLKKEETSAKFFAIGRNFRNETPDWSHGFEFNQTEGIVVDKHANLRHLIGYLKEFAKKLGFEKIRIQPAYFPYTEPSLEGAIWNEEKKTWTEVLAAGIFRPEVTEPLLGEPIPVLAWGPGFDRLMMLAMKIKDMREIYKNDIKFLRERKIMT